MSSLKTEVDYVPKAQRLPEREERNVNISNLSEKQKSLLSAAGAGAAGLSLGVFAMTLMGAAIPEENGEINPPTPANGGGKEEVEVTIHTDAPFAEGVNDAMSFGEAFKTARADVGAGGIFEWKGNLYNTYIKSEWDAMDKSERAAFLASIDQDFLPEHDNEEAEIIKIVNDDSKNINDHEDIVVVKPSDDEEIKIVKPEDDETIRVVNNDDIDRIYDEPNDDLYPSNDDFVTNES